MISHYVGARYVPKFADPTAWASGTSYEAMTIVTYNNSSYTSKVPVPPNVGNPADNPDYWALTGNYNAQVEQYRQEVSENNTQVEQYRQEVSENNAQVEKYRQEVDYLKGDVVVFEEIASNYSSVSDALKTYLENGKSVKINATATLDKDLTLRASDVMLYGNTLNLNGHTLALQNKDSVISHTITAHDDYRITLDDASGLSVNDFIIIKGNSPYTFLTYSTVVRSITGNVITVDDNIPISNAFGTIEKLQRTNVSIEVNNITNGTISINAGFSTLAYGKYSSVSISNTGFFNKIHNIVITGPLDEYASGNTEIYDNTFVGQGIRLVSSSKLDIHDNTIHGYDYTYTYGIYITGLDVFASGVTYTPKSYDNCGALYNNIHSNKLINVGPGVAGSGNSGIHLNFGVRYARITNNTCINNNIGIYLENGGYGCLIANNECSYSHGYYGTGIQLDYDCEYDRIIGNNCMFNSGSDTAKESIGIEIRNSGEHQDHYIIISGNTCIGNSLYGIYVGGNNVTVSNNICRGNTTYALMIKSSFLTIVNSNTLENDDGDSIYINNSIACTITSNLTQGKATDITIDNSSRLIINDNYMTNGITANTAGSLIIKNNITDQPATITLNSVTGYKTEHNYNNYEKLVTVAATESTELP